MPTIRSGFGAAVVNDVLYVIGGRTNEYGTSVLSLNEQYVPIGYGDVVVGFKFSLNKIVIAVVITLSIGFIEVYFYISKEEKVYV